MKIRRSTQNPYPFMTLLLSILLLSCNGALGFEISDRFVLPNGLTVIARPDHRLPLVNVTCMYRVGSVNEAPGLTGVAHYVEHMNFRATENISKADITGSIDRIGGRWNGYTSLDQTLYAATVPAWALENVLYIEAERMKRTLFENEDFQRERTSVIAELQGYENDVQFILWDKAVATSFEIHPYRYNIIGWLSDLLPLERDQAYRFYQDYYGPNNAVLVISGDFEPVQMRALVETYFGPIAAAPKLSRVNTREPLQSGEKRVEVIHPGTPLHLVMLYRSPAASDPDYPALLVLDALLAGGRGTVSLPGLEAVNPSSLLQEVVRGAGGLQAGTALTPTRWRYVYGIGATAPTSESLEKTEKAVRAALAGLATAEISPDRLNSAKRRLKSASAFQESRLAGLGHRLAYAEILSTSTLFDSVERAAQQVTAVDLQNYLKKWMQPSSLTVAYQKDGSPPAGEPLEIRVADLAPEPGVKPSPVPDRALQPVADPQIQTARRTLANGARIAAAERPGSAAALHIRLGFGSGSDPAGRAGLALRGLALSAARILTSDPNLQEKLENLGVDWQTTALQTPEAVLNQEYMDLSFRFLPGDQNSLVEALAEVFRSRSVTPSDWSLIRESLLDQISDLDSNSIWRAQEAALRQIYPDWSPPFGSKSSLQSISASDIDEFLRSRLLGAAVSAALVSPVSSETSLDQLQKLLENLPGGKTERVSMSLEMAKKGGIARVPLTGKTQTEVVAALPGVGRKAEEYLALRLLNYILGETGYAGRLGDALVDSGLVYSVYSSLDVGRLPGFWLIQTGASTANAAPTIELLRRVISRIHENGVEEWEVREAKGFLLGRLVFDLEPGDLLASRLVDALYYDTPLLDLAGQSRRILEITREEVNRAARRYLDPALLSIGLAGAIGKKASSNTRSQGLQ